MSTREQIESVATRSIDAWNRHDATAVGALYVSNARFRDSGMPENTKLGRDQIAEYAAQFIAAFADLELKQLSLTVDGDRAVQEWRASGTHTGELAGMPASGRTITVLGCAVWRFGDDGLILDEIQYLDRLGLLADLGALEGTPLAAMAGG
jgi:C-1 hydroxylase